MFIDLETDQPFGTDRCTSELGFQVFKHNYYNRIISNKIYNVFLL